MPDTHLPRRMTGQGETVETQRPIGDAVKTTTCYMCACRCGIKVHLKDGRVRYIEGNPDHPVNRGVICGKGSAGIMTQYSPARLQAPLKRVGPRGSGEYAEISWAEAMETATGWLRNVRQTAPERLAFFTGRDQSQSLTGFWAAQFGTPNFAAHGGFCSVNMAAGGLYTIGGSFWEFGEVDWERSKYLVMFGVAEDHDSNPIKIGLGKMKARGAKFVSVNPVRTGYSAIADEWIGIRPGTDGLLVMALMHELLRTDRVDLEFLVRYTNAAWLVVRNAGGADDGLFLRDGDGKPMAWDRVAQAPRDAATAEMQPAIVGEFSLTDGRKAVPVFQLMAERYLGAEYAPAAVAERCGISAERIVRLADEIADVAFNQTITLEQPWTDALGRRHETMVGRPISFHAMRGISAHSNGFHTCRALHLLQMLLGAVDTPGSWRYKSPFPRPIPPGPGPAGRNFAPNTPIAGNLLAFPHGPDDLLVDDDGHPLRIDKAFSWEAPLGLHGMMHTVIHNAGAGDPYPIDTLFMFMANMAWNSAMNPIETIRILTEQNPDGSYRIPHVIYADAFFSETVPYADLILPDTTYLERWDCISILDRPIGSAHGPGDAIRQPVIKPDRDVRPFQDVLIELGARLGLPAFVKEDGSPRWRDYPDYITNHQRMPGVGPLAGWRGEDGTKKGVGEPNPDQLAKYIENGCFWQHKLPPEQGYFKQANRAYLDEAKAMGMMGQSNQIVMQIWSEPLQKFRLAAQGHGKRQPPDRLRARIETYFDPLPFWYAPLDQQAHDVTPYPLSAVTQRPMAMYHSWGSMNAWLRQIHGANRLYMSRATATKQGIAQDDWVWVESRAGRVKGQVTLMEGVNPDTVWTWNAIGKRSGAWQLSADSPEAEKGFLLNHVITEWLPAQEGFRSANADPVTGQAAWYDLRVSVTKCAPHEFGHTSPHPPTMKPPPNMPAVPLIIREPAR
ncbi:molybdopterin oxidoreductase family protein [Falsiroseomonas sp. E2-1-a20]|uniref:molybdopterin oxidoreductase family protein n=1 Tax=Falsiroseomonas sp. E2-1-a20 TaxID=3239300 RepID=UPI003F3ACD6B